MSFTFLLHSGARCARVLLPLGLLAAPALLASTSTACKCDDCGCQPRSCAATCAGPVVVETCDEVCPEGLIEVSDAPIHCVVPCGDPEDSIEWSCDACPEGRVEDIHAVGTTVACRSACAMPSVDVCAEACPAGTFSDSLCFQACDHPLAECVAACGGAVKDVSCDACAAKGLIDRSACPAAADAGVDGG